MIYINLIYEDDLSEMVMVHILNQFNNKFHIANSYPGHGFGYLKTNIRGFNQASSIIPHFMLTDLDNYICPTELINDWINFTVNPNFIFRIAVKEVESWLLADIEGLSEFLRVSPNNFPLQPEIEIDPKNKLIQLARRSRLRKIREDIVPINDNATIGPNYNGCLIEFIVKKWDIQKAMQRSSSLLSAINKLNQFTIP
ncbi:MAG: hypothetical protein HQ541_12775 [Mariniphaga sp.]|nr:hypothetical protein [Mariniphaga sp.]